jgi:hypothetical protein
VDSHCLQRVGKRFPVEMRPAPGRRKGADIGDALYVMRRDQIEERGERPVGMADAVERQRRGSSSGR